MNRLPLIAPPFFLHACLIVGVLALHPAVSAGAVGEVSMIAGTGEPVTVVSGERKQVWYRLSSAEDTLVVEAEGPVRLALRLRVLAETTSSGSLRIVRDEEAVSENPYELARDPTATATLQSVENPVTHERLLHLQVPEGPHRYELSAVRSAPVVVRVTRTKHFQPAFAVYPERALVTKSETVGDERVEPKEPEEPGLAVTLPAITWGAVPTTSEPASDGLLPAELAFQMQDEKPRVRTGGFAIAARGGAWHLSGTTGVVPSASLELAWDVSPEWSVFLDGAVVFAGSGGEVAVMPVGLGLARFMALGETLGIRLKLLGEGAWVNVPLRSGFRAGVMVALALEAKAGPGRVSLEPRALWLGARFGKDEVLVLEAKPLWGVGALLGYRLEL